MKEYLVQPFIPTVSGCLPKNNGWDDQRTTQFQDFLNENAKAGWNLVHIMDRTEVSRKGCLPQNLVKMVCTFERDLKA